MNTTQTHQPEILTTKKLNAWKNKLSIPDTVSFMISESEFSARLAKLKAKSDYKPNRGAVNNYFQPLKAIYIDNEKDSVIACIFNCIAQNEGKNLTWNKNGEMNVFPPKYQEYVSAFIPVDYYMEIIQEQERLNKLLKSTPKKYTVLIYWSAFVGKSTKHFVNQVRTNVVNHVADSCRIIYINSDEFYAKRIKNKN